MKTYRIEVTDFAESQIEGYLHYLMVELKNEQAYKAVKNDYRETLERLKYLAESIKLCSNPALASRGLRKISFRRHDYVILYRLKEDVVEVTEIYHTLQDYENKIK